MKKGFFSMLGLAVTLAVVGSIEARNVKYLLPIDEAMQTPDVKQKPNGSVKFFFANQQLPEILKRLASSSIHGKVATRPETDKKSCNAAFLEALVGLQNRAHKLGANAVVNIVSYFKTEVTASPTEFECHAGAAAHVMLKGEFVQIPVS